MVGELLGDWLRFPAPSVALQVTVVVRGVVAPVGPVIVIVPSGKTLPEGGAQLTTGTGSQ